MELSYRDAIIGLKNEYSGGVMYGEKSLNMNSVYGMNNGFMGSANVVCLNSTNSIHEAPACIAAPSVTMVANNVLSLGVEGRGDQSVPVRIYAPVELTIKAKHLLVRDVMMPVIPKKVSIICEQLTLLKSTEEEPPHFKIFKDGIVNKDAKIETIFDPLLIYEEGLV